MASRKKSGQNFLTMDDSRNRMKSPVAGKTKREEAIPGLKEAHNRVKEKESKDDLVNQLSDQIKIL